MQLDSKSRIISSNTFDFHEAPIEGVYICTRKPHNDPRGSFTRMYCLAEFLSVSPNSSIAHVNHSSTSAKGTIRGIHFQHPPQDEVKCVSCLVGKVFDVVVDIRSDSPTFLRWFGIELSSNNDLGVIVPNGVAHGYQTLEDNTSILYFVNKPYCKNAEDGINPFDPIVNIMWPAQCTGLSERDKNRPFIDKLDFRGIELS